MSIERQSDPYSVITIHGPDNFELQGDSASVNLQFPESEAFVVRQILHDDTPRTSTDFYESPSFRTIYNGSVGRHSQAQFNVLMSRIKFTFAALGSTAIRREQASQGAWTYTRSPAYTIDDVSDNINAPYDLALTTAVRTEKLGYRVVPAITANNLGEAAERLDLDIDPRVALRTLAVLGAAAPEELQAIGMNTTENFVTGRFQDPKRLDKAPDGEGSALKVASLPKLLAASLHRLRGLGPESIALLYAYSDALWLPSEEKVNS